MTENSPRRRSSKTKEDYYEILEVNRHVTDEEIKQAYRKLALKYRNPDKNSDADATTRFQEINKAYKVLGDPKLRSTYDLLGAQATDLIENYEEYPEAFTRMSKCTKFLLGLLFILTGCCCGCLCCCFFCGGFCCMNCFCNCCCGKCGHAAEVSDSSENVGIQHSQQNSSVHRQPTDNTRDSNRF